MSELPKRDFAAFFFDMDGTVLSSIKAAERVWTAWAGTHNLNIEELLPTIHGIKAEETIRRLQLPGVDPVLEAEIITAAELEDLDGIEEIPGATSLLAALPDHRWGIVTSAPSILASRRIHAAGLPKPELLITAEDVGEGKPAPDCFRLAASRLGYSPSDCLVFEDSAAGVQSATAAGMTAIVVTATHSKSYDFYDVCIPDYRELSIEHLESGFLRIHGL